jgi:hypothetical protein
LIASTIPGNVVAKGKAAGKGKNMKVVELLRLGNEIGNVHRHGIATHRRQVKGMGRFLFTVNTVAGQD